MFSSGLANTLPFVSHAMHVGGSDGRTNIMGPTTSFVASAVTQESSSAGASSSGFEAVSSLDVEESPNLDSKSTRFRFLGFLSPLNVRSLPILEVVGDAVGSLERVLELVGGCERYWVPSATRRVSKDTRRGMYLDACSMKLPDVFNLVDFWDKYPGAFQELFTALPKLEQLTIPSRA
jgi:hypothetical protein